MLNINSADRCLVQPDLFNRDVYEYAKNHETAYF